MNKLLIIKSKYILQKILGNLQEKKFLEIIKHNKNIQNRINICTNNYKEYSEKNTLIEIEIIPAENKFGDFINIDKKEDEKYYHIYFDNNKEEIKKNCLNEDDKVTKIKIVIDPQMKSFERLFYCCKCIESIYFKKFYRNNFNDMSFTFHGCTSLKELNLSNFNTNNVINMYYMFPIVHH